MGIFPVLTKDRHGWSATLTRKRGKIFQQEFRETTEKVFQIFVVPEGRRPFDPSYDQMVKHTWSVDA
jgi:hypothetical protein